jgi:hypothetical protein
VSQTWTMPTGTAVAGFTASSTSGSAQLLQSTVCPSTPNCAAKAFYWVDTGTSRQLTFTLNLDNGKSSSATVTFNVDGPRNASFTATSGRVDVWSAAVAGQGGTNPWLGDGNVTTLNGSGINFKVDSSTQLPTGNSGTYSWVQLIGPNLATYQPGSTTRTLGTGLDGGRYPYPMMPGCTDCTNDSPGIELLSVNSEETDSFQATMYLMWTPNPAGGCSACTVPVPIGFVNWRMKGDAINTLDPNQGPNANGWILGCGQNSADPFIPSTSYPQWTSASHNF